MSRDETELDAGEYVLGTLDPEERRRFARNLDGNAELKRLTEAWERRLEPLSEALDPVAPPEDLWSRIEAGLDQPASDAAFGQTIRAGEGEWQALFEGVEKKILLREAGTGFESYLLRMAPGSRLPSHGHKLTEECLVLEGDLWMGDLHLSAGDFHSVTPDEIHPEVFSRGGALLYLRGEIHASMA